METFLLQPAGRGVSTSRRVLPVLGLAALLLAEILVLTYRFDAQALLDRGGWGALAAYARYLPQGLMAATAAVLVLGGSRVASATTPAGAGPAPAAGGLEHGHGRGRGAWPLAWLAAHLAAFAGLTALTRAVWEGPLGRSPHAAAWVAAWLLAGLASLALALGAVLPAARWAALARRYAPVWPAALAVALAACGAGRLTATLGAPLNAATFAVVRGLLALMFAGVEVHPGTGVVGTDGFLVEIAPECSGYEGIGLVWVFLAAYLWFFRRDLRFPRALWLLPLGTLAIWLANVLRIVALVALGARVSPEVALGGFHSQAGWLAFNAVALGLVVLSRRCRVFAASPEAEPEPAAEAVGRDGVNATAAHLVPLLALVATVMVTGALGRGTGFDALYPVRVLAVAAALLAYRRGYAGPRPARAWSWPAVALGAVAFAVWMALEPAPDTAGAASIAAGLAGLPCGLAAAWLAARVVGSVVTVPIAEELAFRGYLTRRLIAADFTAVPPGRLTVPSLLISSLLFGALHGRWLAGALAGLLYALAYNRKGALSEAVLAHATTNALIAGYVLTTGAWSLWV